MATNEQKKAVLRQQLEALVAAEEEAPGGRETSARLYLEVRRAHLLRKAQAAQPRIAVVVPDDHYAELVAYLRRPIDDAERGPGDLDVMCQAVMDCVESGSPSDVVLAMARLTRKVWALQPHLGKIEG